ncbi:MAG: hypothetical protein JNL35_16540 [Sphingopyxis sp.]|nr:hypothetical protein [Sphingopyxis sp.]
MDILLISFGAGVAPSGCVSDCNPSGTAGVTLLAVPPLLALLIMRHWARTLLVEAREAADRFLSSPTMVRPAA